MIRVRGLCHTYLAGTPLAQPSLGGVDMAVEQGQVVALVGATGSGKSTLLQHLNGLLRPQTGQVWVAGHDLNDPATDLRQVRRAAGLVFQHPEDQLFEQYVGDDVAYGPRLAGWRGPALRERVRWAMELVGLNFERYKDRPIFTLSGGERRKVGLAGVLALRPQVLLLDEPTAGLDPIARIDLLARLAELHAQGMTLVMATHNMDDVAMMADRMYVLAQGRVALAGTPRQVYARVDQLRSLGLDVPSVTAVMSALRARGLPVPLDVLTLDEAEAAILALSPGAVDRPRDGGCERSEIFSPGAGDAREANVPESRTPLTTQLPDYPTTRLPDYPTTQVSEFEFLRNVTIGQYLPTGSAFHRLDPRAKLIMAVLYLAGVLASNSLASQVAALVAVIAGLALARISLRYAFRGVRAALPFLAFLALLQVFTIPRNDTGWVLWQWRWIAITSMDMLAAAVSLVRFVALILGLSLFSFSTSTTELAHGTERLLRPLQRFGLPAHECSLMLVIALRFVPLLALEAERIAKAQASRGADGDRGRSGRGKMNPQAMNPFKRARRMLPLLVPLFVTALRRAETLALAMEARCYTGGKGRTHLIRLEARWSDGLAILLVAILVAGLLAATHWNLDLRLWRCCFGWTASSGR
jgi:energy-coupling factor transport system ATP-binding protein